MQNAGSYKGAVSQVGVPMVHKAGIFFAALSLCGIAPRAIAQPISAPSAEAMATARILVEKAGTGGLATMNGLQPFPRMMKELGIADPRRYAVMVHEAVMPVVNEHSDQLTEIQIRSTASLLSIADMKAAIAFYDSPAGHDLVRLRFKLLQTNMAQAAALVETLKPEFKAQADAALKAHGLDAH